MNTLKDHTLIYDDECPMCNIYTRAFIKTGMLDKEGRQPYSEAASRVNFDKRKACNQIALINRKDNSVVYGIDSLFNVIANSFPIFRPLFQWSVFRAACAKLYSFISYNRKVVAPGSKENTCIPDFSFKYRGAYIIIAWIITSIVLASYAKMLAPLVPQSGLGREFLICGGQVIFQTVTFILLGIKDRKTVLNYLGHLMTISLGGALLLSPMLIVSDFVTPLFSLGFFIIIAGLMLIEHVRRVKLLQLPWLLSMSWVLYRLMILGFIL